MEVATLLATVTVLVVGALMTLALAHKVLLLVKGRAADEPSFAWVQLPHFVSVTTLVGAVAAIEAVLVTLLFLVPVVGLSISALVMIVYGIALRTRQPDVDCGCFGSVLPMTNRAAVWRNFYLAAAAIAAAVVATVRVVHPLHPTQVGAGLALVVLGVIGGYSRASALVAARPQFDEFGR